jgi:hypothetical protein
VCCLSIEKEKKLEEIPAPKGKEKKVAKKIITVCNWLTHGV